LWTFSYSSQALGGDLQQHPVVLCRLGAAGLVGAGIFAFGRRARSAQQLLAAGARFHTLFEAATAANGVTVALGYRQVGNVCAAIWE